MGEVWFTSDLHFGHEKLALHRGFSSVESMNDTLVKYINDWVSKHDVLYILGDVAIPKQAVKHVSRLNGHKVVVMGNHDQKFALELQKYVQRIEGAITKAKMFDGRRCVFTHIPIHPQELHRWKLNIHGHLHSTLVLQDGEMPDRRYFNVCPEQHNLKPVHRDKIIARLDTLNGM